MNRMPVLVASSVLLWSWSVGEGRAAVYTVTTTNDSGVGSLRWAIEQANSDAAKDIINFAIPPTNTLATIQPTNALPSITNAVDIDGTSQTGVDCPPGVELRGTLAGALAHGLVISNTGNCDVHGLVINDWSRRAIHLYHGSSNRIYGNYIGTDTNGTGGRGNGDGGLWLEYSSQNDIGLTPLSCTNRNIISGNSGYGVDIYNSSHSNRLRNNYIGTDVTGMNAIPNTKDGVSIGSMDNEVGETSSVKPVNLISGNSANGVQLETASASGIKILGNYIGTTVDGGAPLGNGANGVRIFNCRNSDQIGGSGSEGRNTISANGAHGIEITTNGIGHIVEGNYIGTDAQGLYALGNHSNGVHLTQGTTQNTIGGGSSNERNIISGNMGCGISIDDGASGNLIFGNYIGLNRDGLLPVTNLEHGIEIVAGANGNYIGETLTSGGNMISGNGMHGMFLDNSSYNSITGNRIGLNVNDQTVSNGLDGIRIQNSGTNYIGHTTAPHGNVISGNGGSGIQLGPNASHNEVFGSFIGTDTNGLLARPNGKEGIFIYRSGANEIGFPTYAFNLISANAGSGIKIADSPLSANNTIIACKIGTDLTGDALLGNSDRGIYIYNSPSNTIGDPAARNVISGNGQDGIFIEGLDSVGNVLWNNYVGAAQDGAASVSNRACGIHLADASQTVIGGTNNLGNLVSGNMKNGIWIEGPGAQRNLVFGNKIGTDVIGTRKLPNGLNGVGISDGACWNAIGSTNGWLANIIAYNGVVGVRVFQATNNAIVGNSIFSNGTLGIDIDSLGVNANDDQDPDVGANMIQNFPVLYSATTGMILGALKISGTLNSVSNRDYRLEFFLNDEADASGYGEGQTVLGYRDMTTDAGGNTNFFSLVFLLTGAKSGQYVTATCTDTNWNTSEFSLAIPILDAALWDADGDGMPSAWESGHGLDPEDATGTNGAAGDPDGDITGNYDEYVADTDPNNESDYFRIVSIERPTNVVVTYTSTNSRYYVVEYATNSASALTSWTSMYSPPVQGANGTTSTNEPGIATNRVYRVSVQLSP
jgi:parallel beta-helix repeat protein